MARATAFFFILLACGASVLAGATSADAAKPCWKRVLDDWSQDSDIDGTYPARCLNEAIAKVPEDVLAYTDFVDQVESSRLVPPRELQNTDPGSGSEGPTSETQPPREREPDTSSKDEGPISSVLGTGNNNADSFPLPLLVLLVLSGMLITAGGAGYGARKLRALRAKR